MSGDAAAVLFVNLFCKQKPEMEEILVEFLEIMINQVLYLRGVYPSQIFKKYKVGNLIDLFSNVYLNNNSIYRLMDYRCFHRCTHL